MKHDCDQLLDYDWFIWQILFTYSSIQSCVSYSVNEKVKDLQYRLRKTNSFQLPTIPT